MLRNIVFIWKNMTYKDLKRILKMNKRLRFFPLVENPGGLKHYRKYFRLHSNTGIDFGSFDSRIHDFTGFGSKTRTD